MNDRLTDEKLAELLELTDRVRPELERTDSLDIRRAILELRARRAADLGREEKEALRAAREVIVRFARPGSPWRYLGEPWRAVAAIDKLVGGERKIS